MSKLDDQLWLGTQQAFDLLNHNIDLADRAQADTSFGAAELPSVTTMSGDTAVISINGPLISGSAGFYRLFGIMGYDDIADELVNALSNPDAKSIVLSINSGGGAVSGVQDLADMIREVDKFKPVVTHTSGMMASAAYWLGASARKVYVTPTSESGSIGVLSIHAERSKQLAEDGVTVTIIRAGKYKALANPYEPLTEAAKAEIQSKADKLYDMFLGYVADRRGMSMSSADKQIGQGRTFLGEDAVKLGLADSLGNLGAAVAASASFVQKRPANMRASLSASMDTGVNNPNNPSQSGNTHMPYTPEQLAAIAAGANPSEVTSAIANLTAETEGTTAEAETEQTGTAEQTATETAEEITAKPTAAEPTLVEFLKGQLAEANETLVALKVELTGLKSQVSDMKATHEGLLVIARGSVGNMLVALNSSSAAADGMDATTLLAEHARVSEIFKSKYKIGGVAATKPEKEDTKKASTFHDPVFAFAASTVSQGE